MALASAIAAEYLDKSAMTMRRWVREGRVPYYKPSKDYMFVKEDLDEFMKKQKR